MGTQFEKIPAENKKLFMRLSQLRTDNADDIIEHNKIRKQILANNQELHAYAVALGDRDQMPRIILNKERTGR